MHGVPKNRCRRAESEANAGPGRVEGLPDAAMGGNQWRGLFCAPSATFPAPGSRTVCLFAACAYLWVMTVHFPFQNTYAALPASFFARVAPTPVAAPRLIK